MTGWYVSILLLFGLIGLHFWWRQRYRSLPLGQATPAGGLTDALGMADIFENMAEGVLVTTHNGVIEFANPTFCKLFGLSSDPKGRTVMEAIRLHEVHELINLLGKDNQIVQQEIMLPNLVCLIFTATAVVYTLSLHEDLPVSVTARTSPQ